MSVCSNFFPLCLCQVLFELVCSWESYYKNKRVNVVHQTYKPVVYLVFFQLEGRRGHGAIAHAKDATYTIKVSLRAVCCVVAWTATTCFWAVNNQIPVAYITSHAPCSIKSWLLCMLVITYHTMKKFQWRSYFYSLYCWSDRPNWSVCCNIFTYSSFYRAAWNADAV